MKIPFNKPFLTGNEFKYIHGALDSGHLSGDGDFTRKCQTWLEDKNGCNKALLTHSSTGALEMAALLADIKPGDEVIMPSFTFVSTANAFVLRGAVPVFVDIRPDTLNLDEKKIQDAITDNTRAIVPVHYAGVGCEMEAIMEVAQQHGLYVIEDAAQCIHSFYKGRPLGSIGDFATLSFHETKNIMSGEGGALLINAPNMQERAETVREKGTNRSQFFRGEVDRYTWVGIGSSYLPGEITAAFLMAQLEETERITERRLEIWNTYHASFEKMEKQAIVRRPIIPTECTHNAHMYYLLLPDLGSRTEFIKRLAEHQIHAVFHYVPLHNSPMGNKVGKVREQLSNTQDLSQRLVRLPLWPGIEEHLPFIMDKVQNTLESL